MIAEANDEMVDSHWMAYLSAELSALTGIPWVPVGACHTWTRSTRLRTTKPAPPFTIQPRTELRVNIWKSAGGWRQGFEAKVPLRGWLHSLVDWCDDCWDGKRLVPWENP